MKLGPALKQVRLKVGLTQIQVSKKSKISQTSISLIESGDQNPSRKTIDKLLKLYDVPEIIVQWMATERKDTRDEHLYDALAPALNGILEQYFEKRKKKREKNEARSN